MANFAEPLKNEIVRLARKEVAKSQKDIKKASASIRKENSELKNRVKILEKIVASLQKLVGPQTENTPVVKDAKAVKIQPRSITTLRKKHALSVLKMAQLLKITNKSLDRWEKGIGTPQADSKKKILAFKKLSKVEVRKMLQALKAGKVKTTETVKAPAKKATPKKKVAKKKSAPKTVAAPTAPATAPQEAKK